ncbi:hypothetical protein TSAR_008217 [Trichomalopsis sarcophagae]|uniref:DUF4817 domain-containing protein n=1 Tax=Trichomalopsis sarcophagae TaxID=543379 RepID=A0A232EHA7_9HYME|nr:hypothetical protein TSAR_008217 [Trichomalopsis sarcophagae]
MADYSPNEIVDMIIVLGECHNNYNAAAKLYAERFPDSRHPTNITIHKLVDDSLLAKADAVSTTKMMHVLLPFLQLFLFCYFCTTREDMQDRIRQACAAILRQITEHRTTFSTLFNFVPTSK